METTTKKSFAERTDEERRDLVLNHLSAAEVSGSESKAHSLSHAGAGNSGYTIGKTQIDFAQDGGKLNEFMAGLAADGKISEDNLKKIREGLSVKGNPNALNKDLKKNINDYLASENGKITVKKMDEAQAATIRDVAQEVVTSARSNPRYNTDPAFRAFVDSQLFFTWAADNANQYGAPTKLKKFVAGEKVEWNHGPVSELKNEPLNVKSLANFENEYKWVRVGDQKSKKPDMGASDIKRRRNLILEGMKAAGDLTDDEAASYKNIIDSTYKSTNQRNAAAAAAQKEAVAKKAAEAAAAKKEAAAKKAAEAAAKKAADGAKAAAGTAAKKKGETPEATKRKKGAFLAPGLGQTLMTAALSSNESEPEDGLTEEERQERRMRALYPTMFA